MTGKWTNDAEYISKTTAANLVATTHRAETGQTRKAENKELPNNLYKNPDGGYDIRIMREGQYKITSVTDKTKTDEQLLQLAIKRRDEILQQMDNDEVDWHEKKLDHNGEELPKGIITVNKRGSDGYMLTVEKDKKRIERTFLDRSLTMDDKLNYAKQMLEFIRTNFDDKEAIDAEIIRIMNVEVDHNGNQLPEGIKKYKARGDDGYCAFIKVNGRVGENMRIAGKSKTMDEKLEMAKQWLAENAA